MSTIGIYDYDFMTHGHVIPNLECAKLCSYYKNKNHISVLAPKTEPERYTNFIVRKDYDDGVYPQYLFKDNVIYGGYAFTGNHYIPLNEEAELTTPDFTIYEKFKWKFGDDKGFKSLLRASHGRISLDNKSIWNRAEESFYFKNKTAPIFLHDYNLAQIEGAADYINDLSLSLGKTKVTIGTKFPIRVTSEEELGPWLKLRVNWKTFFIQYDGVMSNELIKELIETNIGLAKVIYYNPCAFCKTEEEFYKEILPKIFLQMAFLRNYHLKISLIIETNNFLYNKTLENLLKLLSMYCQGVWKQGYRCSLYYYTRAIFNNRFMPSLTKLECQEVFQLVREKNYEVFKLFYECDNVEYKGGEIIDVTPRNTRTN